MILETAIDWNDIWYLYMVSGEIVIVIPMSVV